MATTWRYRTPHPPPSGGSWWRRPRLIVPRSVAAQPQAQWRSSLQTVSSAPATIYVAGDSVSEGQGASTRNNRWIDLVRDAVRAAYPVGVAGGQNYLPAAALVWSPDSTWGTPGVVTGTVSWDNWEIGPGLRGATMSAGATITYTVTGTSVDIWYTLNGGSFTYTIDGGSPSAAVNTAGTYGPARVTGVSLGSAGSHTVKITASSGTVYFVGLTVFNGDTAAGVQMFDGSHSGATSATMTATDLSQIASITSPDLVILEYGLNDNGNSISASATAANVTSMISALRALSPAPSILILAAYNPATSVLATATWQTYVTALQGVATAQNTDFLDLSALMPTATTAGTGYYSTDGLHPNDSGHAVIAGYVLSKILPTTKTVAAAWNTRRTVTKTVSSTWNTRTSATKTVPSTWGVRTSVSGSAVAAAWNVRAIVGKLASSTWPVRSTTTKTVASTWSTRARAAGTSGSAWNVRASVGKTSTSTWSVRTRQAKTAALTWNVRAPVIATTGISWNTRTAVTKTVAATWNTQALAVLISEYGFTDGTDSSGNGYDLTMVGSPSVPGGHTGNGATTGTANRFEGPVGPNTALTDWTVMAWVKFNAFTGPYRAVLSNGGPFYFEFTAGGSGGADLYIECYSGTSPWPNGATGYTIATAPDTWIHVATTRDSSGVSRVFVNGTLVGTGQGNAVNFGTSTFEVGSYGDGTQYTLDGLIDDLRVFQGALTDDQITTWMNTPVGPATTTVTTTVDSAWAVRSAVIKSAGSSWNTRARISKTAATSWAVRTTGTKATSSTWSVRAAAGKTAGTAWNTRARVGKTTVSSWAVRVTAGKTVVSTWGIRARVLLLRSSAWNIASDAGTVLKAVTMSWNTRARSGRTVDTAWAVRVRSGKTATLSWATRARTGGTYATAWNTRATDSRTVSLSWDVRVCATKAVDIRWNTESDIIIVIEPAWPIHLSRSGRGNILRVYREPGADNKITIGRRRT